MIEPFTYPENGVWGLLYASPISIPVVRTVEMLTGVLIALLPTVWSSSPGVLYL
jgi:hypothetical protein